MDKHNNKHIISFLALKMLLALAVLLAAQIEFYVCNRHIFHPDGFQETMGIVWGNMVFGMATIGTFLSIYSILTLLPIKARWNRWYRTISEVFYIVPVLLILIPRGCNTAYFQYTYRLLSDEIFSYLGISGQMGSLVPLFAVDYWYAWVVPLCIAIIFFIVNSRIRLANYNPYDKRKVTDYANFVCGILVLWFMIRGGFGHFIRPTDAANYCQPKNAALVSNDAYNILYTLFTSDLKEVNYMPEQEAMEMFSTEFSSKNTAFTVTDSIADTVSKPQRNVVIIILESFGQEFMGCYNTKTDADTRTPFLDSLARYSTLYNGRSNGKKSIEGITAITTSIPNLMSHPFTNSKYSENDFIGLPTILKRHGYYSGFFHGSYNGAMDFDKMCQRIGFDEYLGMNEYYAEGVGSEEDYDGVWGIYDEPFLQYAVRHIGTYRQPFFAEMFTVTSHHPFPIPESHKGEFKEGHHPILKCVEYTDYALRRFFDEAKKQAWFENTIFIITGDHSGHGLSDEYNDYDGWYRIPMIIYDPQNPVGKRNDRIMQHTDIFPTLLDHLGFDDKIVTFGESAIQNPTIGHQVYYGNGFYCMVSNNTENQKEHDITVICGEKEIGTPVNILRLKAIIQQYNDRLINDKLIAK